MVTTTESLASVATGLRVVARDLYSQSQNQFLLEYHQCVLTSWKVCDAFNAAARPPRAVT
jgi:hypothetical protein